ncbi:NUDIX hydrolase [Clostridium sp. HBUAS56010]|uniref:NUDIX hydrolase n=1 Tax=Clostridium sp. HBUAS56010 TaxID=2571127 RepID=UPI001177EFF6|nr:NUDIX hydrolase [Clostridium sp. HBUAS56010]
MDKIKQLMESVEHFQPMNEQEKKDKERILVYLHQGDSCFYRENEEAHFSSSGWVVNEARNKVLMAYHNIYDSWAWTGGHADGETDLLYVAMKEAQEETGIKVVTPVLEDIFSLEILTVNGHEKKGVYVPSHLHLNITYLLEADDRQEIHKKEDENSGVGWFGLEECLQIVREPWMKERIYQKLIQKVQNIAY